MVNRLIGLIVILSAHALYAAEPLSTTQTDWHDTFYPYRLTLTFEQPLEGTAAVDLTLPQIINALEPVCVDVLDEDNLAVEKAVLVNPTTGRVVGGFRLVPDGPPVSLDGEFAQLSEGQDSPWRGFEDDGLTIRGEMVDGAERHVLWAERDQFKNTRLRQRLAVEADRYYLLSYWVNGDPADSFLSVELHNPQKRLFPRLHHSYYEKITPRREWTHQQVLYRPDATMEAELVVSLAFTGRSGVTGIELQPVKWQLVTDTEAAVDRLDLYFVCRAGHRLPDLNTEEGKRLIHPEPVSRRAAVGRVEAESQDLNPQGVLIDNGHVVAWSVPSQFPLRVEKLHLSRPRPTDPVAQTIQETIHLGESATVLIAVVTHTPYVTFTDLSCDLPLSTHFEQVAEVPVYDAGLEDGGKLIQRRLDPLVPVNYDLIPPSSSGVHLLAVTLRAEEGAPVGAATGTITIGVRDQVPNESRLEVPIRVEVMRPVIKPMNHFGAMFGTQLMTRRWFKATRPLYKDSVTIAEFHGYVNPTQRTDTNQGFVKTAAGDTKGRSTRDLEHAYAERLLDYSVQHQTFGASPFVFKLIDGGPGKTLEPVDWNFSGLDAMTERFLIDRGAPWLVIYHTNGHQIDKLRDHEGMTYSYKPATDDRPWRQMPREQFYALVGDLFEEVAKHMHELGVLDRAMVVIDESDPSTYEDICAFVEAVKARPHGKYIRFAHSTYKPSTYTRRRADGSLMLDGVLDIPMPNNDEHGSNVFEPEWNARMHDVDSQWVYYVETDHLELTHAGLSSIITPLKLDHFGASGWYCWASAAWSFPYSKVDTVGPQWPVSEVVNPWLNPFYHHGPGVLSFFYPPDPRGPATGPTDQLIPSYRLSLMRDGIEDLALLKVLEAGKDDEGESVEVDAERLKEAHRLLDRLWPENPVQWYLSYQTYRQARELLDISTIRPESQ